MSAQRCRCTPTYRSCRSAIINGSPLTESPSIGSRRCTTASTSGAYQATPRRDDGYLAFIGRIHPEKGPALAVEIARRVARPLHVAAKIDPLDVDYYRNDIEPLFETNGVLFVGELDEPFKPAFYAGATATLFPSDWPEPFGLVMIESMAAGTPVIALRRGSVPEIIVDGVTGYICEDIDEMVEAVGRVDELDPAACRRHAATFDATAMCRGYEHVYETICAEIGLNRFNNLAETR